MRSASDWKRLGSEAEAMDREKGSPAHGTDLDDAELRDVLDALVDGYRNGG